MNADDKASPDELKAFLKAAPDTQSLELIVPDLNGIPRGKRIPRDEFDVFFRSGVKNCGGTPLMSCKGETIDELGLGTRDGDPDMIIYPVKGTIAPIPWLASPTGQALVTTYRMSGEPSLYDPRHTLRNAMRPLYEMGLRPVIATELEFYLLEDIDGPVPRPRVGRIPGTNLPQDGYQYAMMEDLWESDDFLEDVYAACRAQHVPATTAHSEFAPGQLEINLHHVDDPVTACDHAVLLKRAIKGVARRHRLGATFMAKPFQFAAGCGLHVHVSVYNEKGENILADGSVESPPRISESMRHAMGGLAHTMADFMAVFAPNANSYRRLRPKAYVPLKPNWGYNHRGVALRIPVCDLQDMRIEHRVAGADANPYLVVGAILAGIHYGLEHRCDPGEMVAEGTFLDDEEITLPTRWEAALERFDKSAIVKDYFGKEWCRIFSVARHSECEQFNAQVSNRDYEWYLRAV